MHNVRQGEKVTQSLNWLRAVRPWLPVLVFAYLLISCSTVEYVTRPIPVPVLWTIPAILPGQMVCPSGDQVTDSAWAILVNRDALRDANRVLLIRSLEVTQPP